MKIKDKVSGEVYEAETWKSWNGAVQYMKKGTNGPIRTGDDVEIIEEDKPKDTTDWAAFRRETARNLLPFAADLCDHRGGPEAFVKMSIRLADELIKQLKEK